MSASVIVATIIMSAATIIMSAATIIPPPSPMVVSVCYAGCQQGRR
jgi:hypothetical protein